MTNKKSKNNFDKFTRKKQPYPPPSPQKKSKGSLIFMLIIITLFIFLLYNRSTQPDQELNVGQFMEYLENHQIKTIEIRDNEIQGELSGTPNKRTYVVICPDRYLDKEKIDEIWLKFRTYSPDSKNFKIIPSNTFITQLFYQVIPLILLFGVLWFLLFRQFRGPSGVNPFSFAKSRARLYITPKKRITFKDVAGVKEAKEEVKQIIEFLKNPRKFQKIGARIPRGILLVGPPGTGKTLLAKAIAGEAEVPFFSISGSDFVEMFVGVGASRVRDLFKQAKDNTPCIIFLDEIDAVGRRRGTGLGGGHDEREQTLNAILVEMDGFDTNDEVIVIAATNRPDVLDPALLRPGRFDRQVVLDMPDLKGRLEILKIHAKKIKMDENVDFEVIAKTTPSFSGAELEALINEASLIAVMQNKERVDTDDLEEARDKVRWGLEKRSRVLDEEDKKITACHEAGHALIAKILPEAEPLHKVSIIPRGMMGGVTMMIPKKDRHYMQKNYVIANIIVMFGGRAAEELLCKDISAGARNDIKHATELARLMVCEWGMSEKMGPLSYQETEEHLFLGREVAKTQSHSEKTWEEIDTEIRKIVTNAYEKAKEIISQNKEACQKIAEALLKYEILTGKEVDKIINGEDIDTIKKRKNEKNQGS